MDKLETWIETTPYVSWQIEKASEDASFRRYFRLRNGGESLIVMDASREKAALPPFVDVTQRLAECGVHAPRIVYEDLPAGFLVLEDLGSVPLLSRLDTASFERDYERCMAVIVRMQHARTDGLPPYDRMLLLRETALMQTWFWQRYLGRETDAETAALLQEVQEHIADVVLSQPQGVFVHRDFHSRNIMVTPSGTLGIIDYQDAVNGPVTYDLVSLLKDLYVRFDPDRIAALALRFRDAARIDADDAAFLRWFDYTGMQRHLKVLGIFARLWLRDGKAGYLDDLPLTLQYTIEAAARYEATRPLARLLETVRLP